MTKSTTAECIEWLMKIILADGWSSNPKHTAEYNAKINATIRAKLLAADEMASGLEYYEEQGDGFIAHTALTAYREAGGTNGG